MKEDEIVNAAKEFRDYIMFKYDSENTAQNYESAITSFLAHFPQVSRPKEIAADQIIQYLLRFENLSTRRNAHSAIKLFYKFKSKNGFSNKFRYIPYPEKPDTLPAHVNKEEFLKIISVCKNVKHQAIMCVLFDCGLRVGEVIDLKLIHIDRSNMILDIKNAKGRKDRKVNLTNVLLAILDNYISIYRPVEYVFNGQGSVQYSIRSIQQVVKQLCKKAGITKEFSPHKFRHGFAMSLLENGEDISAIQNQLGHESERTTKIYARIDKNRIHAIQSPLEQIMQENRNLAISGL